MSTEPSTSPSSDTETKADAETKAPEPSRRPRAAPPPPPKPAIEEEDVSAAAPPAKRERAPKPIKVDDEDIELLAKILTDAQLDKLIAIRRGHADQATWAKLGIIPGTHLIATTNIRCMVDKGKNPGHLRMGSAVVMASLDADTLKDLRDKKLLVPPGTPEGVKALASVQ